MKKFVLAAAAALFVSGSAQALTIPSGSVIDGTTGEVTPAHETATGKAKLAKDGYLVSGNTVVLDIEGQVVVTDIDTIRDGELEAELEAQGIVIADDIDGALASGGVSTAVNEAQTQVAAAVKQAADDFLRKHAEEGGCSHIPGEGLVGNCP